MIIVFLANGFEEIEALTPIDVLRRAGEHVVTVGIGGTTVRGAHGIVVEADTDDAHLPEETPHMVVLPGGMPGATHLDESAVVADTLSRTAVKGGYLTAICAAPMVLGHRGYLRGRRATCYPGFEDELTGAEVIKKPCVVRDGTVITATGMGVALPFALSLVEALQGTAAMLTLRDALQVQP